MTDVATANVLDLWPGLCSMVHLATDPDATPDSRKRAAQEGVKYAELIGHELNRIAKPDYD